MNSEDPSRVVCMEYISQELQYLDEDALIKIGQTAYASDPSSIQESSDGTRIFLNSLSDKCLLTIYYFVRNQITMT